MPLSTSNSRLPDGPWVKTLLLAAAFFLSITTISELMWRHMGFQTNSYTDDERLWSLQREKLSSGDTSNTVVLLGTSRMLFDFSAPAFARHTSEHQLVRLGVLATVPFATLRDLAQEKNFKGIVLIDVTIDTLLYQNYADQQPYVDFYHKEWNINHRLNRHFRSFLEAHLVMMDQRLNPKDFFRGLRGHVEFPYLRIEKDRSHYADYDLIPEQAASQLKNRARRPSKIKREFSETDKQVWLNKALKAETYVEAIQKRGGHVVFLHLPLSKKIWHWQKKKKQAYWDLFAAKTAAVAIHFADYPQLQFETPDGSHLDYRDAAVFTENLLKVLTEKGIIKNKGSSLFFDNTEY